MREYESDQPRTKDDRIVDAIACLANAQGGNLPIGVEDDGRITGAVPRRGGTADALRLQAVITEPDAMMADLDPREFERLRRLASHTGASTLSTLDDIEIGRALGVIDGSEEAPLVDARHCSSSGARSACESSSHA